MLWFSIEFACVGTHCVRVRLCLRFLVRPSASRAMPLSLLVGAQAWTNFGEMHPCMTEAATSVAPLGGTCVLANISTGSYFAWPPGDTPLRLANATLVGSTHASSSLPKPFPMAVLQGIGPPQGRYVHDLVSESLVASGLWEISELDEIAAAAGVPGALATPASGDAGTVVDVGAHVGAYAFGAARAGFRVIAVEPFLPNLAALHATRCMHPELLADRLVIVPSTIGSEAQQGPCNLQSASKNDLGNAKLNCADSKYGNNTAARAAAIEKHRNTLREGTTTGYMFHHRVMHQLVPAPLPGTAPMLTLDALLLDGMSLPPGVQAPTGLALVKIDTAGSECEVLDGGARALLHKLRPRFMLINVEAPASASCVKALAEKHGFALHRLKLRSGSENTHVVLADRHQL